MCGVFGIVSNQGVGRKIARGLYDLQHRGEQAAGIVVSNGEVISVHSGHGLVTEIFTDFLEDN